MKKAIYVSNTLTRLMKAAAAALMITVLSTSAVHAADKPKNVPAEVKYIGSTEGRPVFQISLDNPQSEEVLITLRDENGVTIYTDTTRDKSYARKLQFNELDTDKIRLTLTLRTKRETQTQAFEITRSMRVVEDVAVVTL